MEVEEKLVQLIAQAAKENKSLVGELAAHLIDHGVTVQDWIPVTERLPEPKESPVLAYHISGVCIAWRYCNCWVLPSGIKTIRVTHWMPLPQPPREERKMRNAAEG